MKRISVKELTETLQEGYYIIGDIGRLISKASPIDEADSESLSFATTPKGPQAIHNSRAGVIVCPKEFRFLTYLTPFDKTLICVDNPRLTFIRLLLEHFTDKEYGISSSIIGRWEDSGIMIGPTCYIGRDCEIGEETIIYPNVTLYSKTKIGKRVIIHSGTVIGADGFGFEKNEQGHWEKFPQIGGVIIEDDVEIQANSAIDRASLTNTIIGEGTKIDNLVHIGHNVRIGKDCFITAGVIIGGSVIVRDDCWIGLNATLRDWITLGNNVLVGMGTVVTKSFGDNVVLAGVPAKVIRENE